MAWLCFTLGAIVLGFGASSAQAAKTVETTWPDVLGDIAVRESTGQVYVAESSNRIQRLDSEGNFERIWGWDVVQPGGVGSVAGNERQRVSVVATGGTFTLELQAQVSAPIAYDASAAVVQEQLEALPNLEVGDVAVTGPAGGPWEVEFTGARAGLEIASMGISDGGLTGDPRRATVATVAQGAGFEICTVASECQAGAANGAGGSIANPSSIAVSQSSGHVYVFEAGRVSEFDADGNFIRAFGWDVVRPGGTGNVPGNERQVIAKLVSREGVPPTSGSFQLTWNGTTAPIPYNASAAEVEAALEGLVALGPADVSVSGVSGGPWTVEFGGIYADTGVPVVQGRADGICLAGSFQPPFEANGNNFCINPRLGTTVRDGGSFEVCTVAAECQREGTDGAISAGQIPGGVRGSLAIDESDGRLFVAGDRIDEFDLTSADHLRGWGWGVDTGAAKFEICTQASTCQSAWRTKAGSNQQFSQLGELREPPRLAVDPAGILYAASGYPFGYNGTTSTFTGMGTNFVTRYDPDEAAPAGLLLPNPITSENPPATCGYCSPGPLPQGSQSEARSPLGIEVDPDTSHLLYLTEEGILELDTSADPPVVVDTHLPNADSRFEGLAIDTSRDKIYVGFTPPGTKSTLVLGNTPSTPQAVELLPTTGVTASAAELHGEVTPNGPPGINTSYRFEYSPDSVSWLRVPSPDESLGDGSAPVPVSQSIEGLEANKLYQVRLVATKQLGLGTITSSVETFKTLALPVAATTLSPQWIETDGATLKARINPHNSPTTYFFEYGETTSYGNRIPIPDGSLTGGQPKAVFEELTGLEPETTYHYRVVATNGIEESPGDTVVEGADVTFTTRAVLPDAPERGFEMVTPPFKVVRAPVRQGSSEGYNANTGTPSLDGETMLWDVPFFPLTDEVGWPSDADRRIIRRTPTGWVNETRNTLRLQPGGFAWLSSQGAIGSSGDLLTQAWLTTGGAQLPENGGLLPTEGPVANRSYTFRLGTGVEGYTPWLTNPSLQIVALGHDAGDSTRRDAAVLNDDGTAMARWGDYGGLAEDPTAKGDEDPSNDQNLLGPMLYSQRAAEPDLLAQAPKDLVNECTGTVGTDATQVPVRDNNATPGDNTDDVITAPASCAKGRMTQARGAVVGGGGLAGPAATALSADGNRIFFQSPDPQLAAATCAIALGTPSNSGGGSNCPSQLFVRQYMPDGGEVVRWISRSRSTAGTDHSYSGPIIAGQEVTQMGAGVAFQGASRDGRYVYFKTNAPLVPSDPNGGEPITAGSASDASWDLYRYELPESLETDPNAGSLTRISGGPSGNADPNTNPSNSGGGGAARFISDDGRLVYFVTGAPIPGADVTPPTGGATTPGGGATANTASRNLYLYDENESGADRYRFVARLPFSSSVSSKSVTKSAGTQALNACASFGGGAGGAGGTKQADGGSAVGISGINCFRGTADAEQVTFFSGGQLTGDDTDEAGDVYLYDAESDELVRVSAPPKGIEPYVCGRSSFKLGPGVADCNGDFGFSPGGGFHGHSTGGADRGRGWGGARYSNIFRDSDGAVTVVFESSAQLVPEDENEHWDVYQWRNGTTSLVSRGLPGHHSYFSGNSTDGRDLFIWTTDRIDPRELDDGSFDIYDARIGGGFPYAPPPTPCNVLALGCEGGANSAPAPRGGATAAFAGPGNVLNKGRRGQCRKGKVRRKGRCVRRNRRCAKGKVRRKSRCIRPDRRKSSKANTKRRSDR